MSDIPHTNQSQPIVAPTRHTSSLIISLHECSWQVFGASFPSSATMSNDNLGSHMGLATLGELEREESVIRTSASAFESSVRSALEFPLDQLQLTGCGDISVGGSGLLVSVRLRHDGIMSVLPARWPPNLLMHVYLLRVHGVRTRPSGGDRWTLIVEPPAVISCTSVTRVCTALRELALLVLSGDISQLHDCVLGHQEQNAVQ